MEMTCGVKTDERCTKVQRVFTGMYEITMTNDMTCMMYIRNPFKMIPIKTERILVAAES